MSTIPEIQPVRALFAKKGGTWDMDVDANGKLIGVGNLGDAEIHKLMEERRLLEMLPKSERIAREKDLSAFLLDQFRNTQPLDIPVEEYFAPWCPDFGRYVTGEFYPLFSGDSSHLTHPFVAAISTNLIERRIEDPTRIVIGAEGTDTADVAFLNQDDVFTFDTDLPPEHFFGSNQSRHEKNSDASDNLLRVGRIVVVDPSLYLPDRRYRSGSFWNFHRYVYSGADVAKFDPREYKLFEDQDTFFSANAYAVLDPDTLTVFRINKLGDESTKRKEVYPYQDVVNPGWLLAREAPPLTHISRQLTAEKLYDALVSIHTVDLGSQNPLADEIEKILDPSYKAIVVAAHGLGNGPEQLKAALVEAAKQGKIVIVTSRAFIPYISERYEESLISVNENPKELRNTNYRIISGQHLSKTAARAVATRAILEGLNQAQAEQLLQRYCEARPPHYGKEVQTEPALVSTQRSGRGSVAMGDIPSTPLDTEKIEASQNLDKLLSLINQKAPGFAEFAVESDIENFWNGWWVYSKDSDLVKNTVALKNATAWCAGAERYYANKGPKYSSGLAEFIETLDNLLPSTNFLQAVMTRTAGWHALVGEIEMGKYRPGLLETWHDTLHKRVWESDHPQGEELSKLQDRIWWYSVLVMAAQMPKLGKLLQTYFNQASGLDRVTPEQTVEIDPEAKEHTEQFIKIWQAQAPYEEYEKLMRSWTNNPLVKNLILNLMNRAPGWYNDQQRLLTEAKRKIVGCTPAFQEFLTTVQILAQANNQQTENIVPASTFGIDISTNQFGPFDQNADMAAIEKEAMKIHQKWVRNRQEAPDGFADVTDPLDFQYRWERNYKEVYGTSPF